MFPELCCLRFATPTQTAHVITEQTAHTSSKMRTARDLWDCMRGEYLQYRDASKFLPTMAHLVKNGVTAQLILALGGTYRFRDITGQSLPVFRVSRV